MPRLIVLRSQTNSVTYLVDGIDPLHIEAVSADIDASAVVSPTFGDVIFTDASGLLIARSRSSASITGFAPFTMTWAPELPDTTTLGNSFLSTVLTTGLADTILPPGTVVTVTCPDAAAIITEARLWVDTVSDVAGDQGDETLDVGRWAYVPGPGA